MKKILFIISVLFIFSCDIEKEYLYCGEIVNRGYEAPTSGYKKSRDPVYYVMMREDKSKQVIRIQVTVPTWYSLDSGKRACFKLSNWELYNLGNTTDVNKNLYGE